MDIYGRTRISRSADVKKLFRRFQEQQSLFDNRSSKRKILLSTSHNNYYQKVLKVPLIMVFFNTSVSLVIHQQY